MLKTLCEHNSKPWALAMRAIHQLQVVLHNSQPLAAPVPEWPVWPQVLRATPEWPQGSHRPGSLKHEGVSSEEFACLEPMQCGCEHPPARGPRKCPDLTNSQRLVEPHCLTEHGISTRLITTPRSSEEDNACRSPPTNQVHSGANSRTS